MTNIEQHYVDEIMLVLDSDEGTNSEIREKVNEAIRHQSGYPDLDPDTYDDLVRSGRVYELHMVIGGAVEDVLYDIIERESSGMAEMLLKEYVQGLTRVLGKDYEPAPDDYREWYSDQI